MKAAELTAKGAVIAGKALGKGTVVAAKAVGKAGAVVGKGVAAGAIGVAKGAKAVAYTAPKAVIGGTVNKVDQVASKLVSAIVPKAVTKIIPKPVKQVASVAKKVVKKTLCLGIFCGIDGIDDYRSSVEQALADAGPRNPLAARRAPAGRRSPAGGNPFHAHVVANARHVGAASSSVVRRSSPVKPNAGRAYYAALLS